MADLPQFAYDVFLSYGWSGIARADEGDRAWVADLKDALEAQISAELGRTARIYLDVEQPTNGELAANLADAVSSSLTFLSVLTPGSCRRGSWCHEELRTFVSSASQVFDHQRQLFSARLRDVDRSEWPDALQPIVPYEFLTDSIPRAPMPRRHINDTTTACGERVQKLAIEIARLVRDAAKQIDRTVLVASTDASLAPRVDRLVREIAARNATAITVSPDAGEPEARFHARLARELRRANLSIHLLPSDATAPPSGWQFPVDVVQRRAATARFANEPKRILVWRDGGQLVDGADSGEQLLHGTGFESLLTQMRLVYERNLGVAVATAAVREEIARAEAADTRARIVGKPRYLFLDCVEQDLARLQSLRAALEKAGVHVKFPLFQGDEAIRRRADRDFLARCDGVAVYFGSRNDLEAYLTCQNLSDAMTDRPLSIPRAVLLDPADDPVRSSFLYPDFTNYPGVTADAFIQTIVRGAA